MIFSARLTLDALLLAVIISRCRAILAPISREEVTILSSKPLLNWVSNSSISAWVRMSALGKDTFFFLIASLKTASNAERLSLVDFLASSSMLTVPASIAFFNSSANGFRRQIDIVIYRLFHPPL